jgi:hypothetical protein
VTLGSRIDRVGLGYCIFCCLLRIRTVIFSARAVMAWVTRTWQSHVDVTSAAQFNLAGSKSTEHRLSYALPSKHFRLQAISLLESRMTIGFGSIALIYAAVLH